MKLFRFPARRPFYRALHCFLLAVLVLAGLSLLAGCTLPALPAEPDPLPTRFLTPAAALPIQTEEAGGQASSTPLPPSPSPRPAPTETVTNLASPEPTQTPGAPAPIPSPTETPALTPTPILDAQPTRVRTPTPTAQLPAANIEILRPGPASKVVSPIRLSAYLEPGAGGKVRVELIGEDGRLMVRKVLTFAADSRIPLLTDIEFEIAAVAEAARLQVVTDDSYGRIVALSSVDLVLLSIGDSDLNIPAAVLEPVVIRQPSPNTLIQGGEVLVSGLARRAGPAPLLIELIDREQRVVGYRQAAVAAPIEGAHGEFSVSVPYTVSATTWVRLTITESSSRIPGPTHVSSVEILLSP